MQIYARTIGQGKDITLLHGWGFDSTIFQPLAANLVKTYRVTLIDLPGFGQSDGLQEYNLANLIQSIYCFIPANSILIGWSLGGLLAVKLAAEYPTKFKKVITIATNPCFVANNQWPGICPELFKKFRQKLTAAPKRLLHEFAFLQVQNNVKQKQAFNRIKPFILNKILPTLEALSGGLNILTNTAICDLLRAFNYPVLFIFSHHDPLIPHAVTRLVTQLNPLIKVKMIADATHLPFLFNQNEVIYAIDKFIQ